MTTIQPAKTKTKSETERLDAFIDAYTPTVANIARGALVRLRRQVPGAVELVGDRYSGLVIGFSPTERPADATLSIVLYPRWVNLFFLRGATLRDPKGLLEGTGRLVRHLTLQDPTRLDDRDVQALVAQARTQARVGFPRRRRIIIKSISAKRRTRRPTEARWRDVDEAISAEGMLHGVPARPGRAVPVKPMPANRPLQPASRTKGKAKSRIRSRAARG